MKFMVLTRKFDGNKVYVNPKQICFMGSNAENDNGAMIQFCGDDENYIKVTESPEAIAELCKAVTDGRD